MGTPENIVGINPCCGVSKQQAVQK